MLEVGHHNDGPFLRIKLVLPVVEHEYRLVSSPLTSAPSVAFDPLIAAAAPPTVSRAFVSHPLIASPSVLVVLSVRPIASPAVAAASPTLTVAPAVAFDPLTAASAPPTVSRAFVSHPLTRGRHPGELRGNARLGTQGTQVEGDKK